MDVPAPKCSLIHLCASCTAGHHPLAVPALPPPRGATKLEEQQPGRSPSPALKRSQSPHRTARPDKPALKRVAPSIVPAAQTGQPQAGTPAPGQPAGPASNVSQKPGPDSALSVSIASIVAGCQACHPHSHQRECGSAGKDSRPVSSTCCWHGCAAGPNARTASSFDIRSCEQRAAPKGRGSQACSPQEKSFLRSAAQNHADWCNF